MMAIQITSIKRPLEGWALWSGMAIKDRTRLRLFIDGDGFDVMEEDVGCRPEGKEDALLVLQAATRLDMLPGFWDGELEQKPAATIVRIGGNERA